MATTETPEPEVVIADAVVTVEEPAQNVIQALSRVMRDLPGIGKGMNADPSQGGYAYRGIEQITGHTQTLFARHGIVMIPEVLEWDREEVTVANKPWHDEKCKIVYRVYGPGGLDDVIEVGPLFTVGRDGSDKGVNKCMTQALKYALIQVLCIGDKKDDADGTTSEAGYRDEPMAEPIDALAAEELRLRLTRVGTVLGGYPDEWTRLKLPALKWIDKMPENLLGTARAILDAAEGAIELGGDVLPPLGEKPAEATTEAGAEEEPGGPDSAPAPELVAETVQLDVSLDLLTNDQLIAAVIQSAGEADVLAPLIDVALDRELDISPPALAAWQAAQSALDEPDPEATDE